MLVVVKNRDLHAAAELFLHLETFRRLDVFEIDGAEGGLERGDDLDKFVGVVGVHFDVENVDAGEFLEQHRLAFHHRLGRQRADRAQAEDGRAIGDDGDEIGARGEARGLGRIGHDGERGFGHARRIGERQIVLRRQRLRCDDGDLARCRKAVVIERGLAHILGHRRQSGKSNGAVEKSSNFQGVSPASTSS